MPLCGPNTECWLCSFVIVQGSRLVLLRNPIFVIFQGVWTPFLSLDLHMFVGYNKLNYTTFLDFFHQSGMTLAFKRHVWH